MDTNHTQAPQVGQALLFWITPIVVSLLLLPSYGTSDLFVWLIWSGKIHEMGLITGYQANGAEHPPGMSLVFYACLQLEQFIDGIGHMAWKTPLLITSWLSAMMIWYWSRNHALALLGGGLCCYFGVGLSYLDGLLFPPLLLAFYFFAKQRVFLGLLCYACACYIKYPPLIFGPFIFIYLVRTYSWVFTLKVGLPVLALYLLACLPFGNSVIDSFLFAFNHSVLSAKALNFNWLLTRYHYTTGVPLTADVTSLSMLGANQYPQVYIWISRAAFFSTLAVTLWLVSKRRISLELMLACAFMGHFSYYMFAIGAHENHFFYSAVLVIALSCIKPAAWYGTAMLVCGINAINVLLFYGFVGTAPDIFLGDTAQHSIAIDVHLVVAALNFVLYGVCWIHVLRRFNVHSPAQTT